MSSSLASVCVCVGGGVTFKILVLPNNPYTQGSVSKEKGVFCHCPDGDLGVKGKKGGFWEPRDRV